MEDESLPRRLGNFFILTGLMLAVLFIIAYAGGTPQPLLLLGGLGAILIGYRLYRSATPPPSGRFSLLRRAREKARQRREQRKQPPAKTERGQQ